MAERTPEEDFERELLDLEYVKLYGAADLLAEVAITLNQARLASGMTIEELSKLTGYNSHYLSRLESNMAKPTFETVGSILALLGYRASIVLKPIN